MTPRSLQRQIIHSVLSHPSSLIIQEIGCTAVKTKKINKLFCLISLSGTNLAEECGLARLLLKSCGACSKLTLALLIITGKDLNPEANRVVPITNILGGNKVFRD